MENKKVIFEKKFTYRYKDNKQYQAIRKYCFDKDISINSFFSEALDEHLKKKKQ